MSCLPPMLINLGRKQLRLFIALAVGLSMGCRPPTTSFVPTPTIKPVPLVDRSAVPVGTPTSLPAPTASSTAASMPGEETLTATPDVAATVTALQKPRVFASYPSPDGQWQAQVIIYDCVKLGETEENAYEQLKLIRVSNKAAQIVDTQLQYCGGLGGFGFKGLFWSPNSRYFYYTSAREGGPDGICSYWEPPIVSFDVTTQRREYLGDGPRSPDGTKIAAWQDQGLIVWDINTGAVGRVQVDSGRVAGPIVWSPNSRALIYLQTTTYCPPRGKSFVSRVDLPDLKRTQLIESEAPSFDDAKWDAPNRLRLFDEEGKEWRYDLATKQLRPAP